MNTNKGGIVKQSGNDVEGYRSQKVSFQPNVHVFLQYSVIRYQTELSLGQAVSELWLTWQNENHNIFQISFSIGAILRLMQDELKSGTIFPNQFQI